MAHSKSASAIRHRRSAMNRILYIHHGGGLGGAPMSLLYLLKQLDRSRYEPVVLTLREGPVVDLYRKEGIETHVAQGIYDFSHTELESYSGIQLWRLPLQVVRFLPSVAATRRCLTRFKPDLVHLNSSTLAASARAAWREKIPIVWHIREPIANGYVGLRRQWLTNHIEHDSTRIISISDFDASRLKPSNKIRVIHNFVDFNTFDKNIPAAEARKKLNLSPAQNVVVMLGGVAYPKGTLVFAQALPLVRKKVPNTKFLVAGQPPAVGDTSRIKSLAKFILRTDDYDRQVMKAASDSIASGHIRFIGQRTDIPQVLAACDVLCFPSVVPHFARPIIEAGAMAKPVVASRLGGPLELVNDGVTGILTPPSDPAALADSIIALLTDPAKAKAMGEAGYLLAKEKFNAEINAKKTFEVYDEIFS
jgi:glycosyltransferase involved in cell wall biosynthesis